MLHWYSLQVEGRASGRREVERGSRADCSPATRWSLHGTVHLVVLLSLLRSLAAGSTLPRSWQVDQEFLGEVPMLSLLLADVELFEAQHKGTLGSHARNIRAIAPEGLEEFDALEEGMWSELPTGGYVWRLRVASSGASSQMLVFSDIKLPGGSSLDIFAPDLTAGRRQCAAQCMHIGPFDVPHSHKLTTQLFRGELVELEYYQPSAPHLGSLPTLLVATVMQGISDAVLARRQSRTLLQGGPPGGPPSHSNGTQFDTTIFQQTSDAAAPCTQSIECDPRYETAARAVVAVYAINMRIRALGLCTGSIVRAPLGRIYLLTADHCFTDKTAISDFEFWLLLFNYQTGCGSSDAPPLTQIVQGVKLLFYNSAADVLLLDVPSSIPNWFKPFYIGYDAQDDAVPTEAVGIHHPHGDVKRISYVNNTIATQFNPVQFPAGEVQPTIQTHFQVTWTQGVTQGGSSGSPLIDVDTHRVVGVLTGGLSSCDTAQSPDYYGRLSRAWDNGLKRFLSNVPEETPNNAAALAELEDHFRSENITMVTNYIDGIEKPWSGPKVNYFPTVMTFYNDTTDINITAYLTTKPREGDVLTVRFSITSLPGNPINITDLISITPSELAFTPDNYTFEAPLLVSCKPLHGTTPGELLRFDLNGVTTSAQDPSYIEESYAKGIIEERRVKWSDYAPIMVDTIPFYLRAEPGHPIESPSGKALFQHKTVNTSFVDFYICALDFGKNLVGQRQRIGATVSVYQDGQFIWTLSHDPLALDPNCIHIVNALIEAGSTYHVVCSDDNDFNALLPAWGIREAYVGPANTLASVIAPNSTFRSRYAAQQALSPSHAAAPTAAQGLQAAGVLAASTQAPALGPTAGGYAVSALKQNQSVANPIIDGPQYTDQYDMYPDNTPGPGAASTASAAAPSAESEVHQASLPSRTTLFGSVLNPLSIAKSGTRAAAAGMSDPALGSPAAATQATKSVIVNLPAGVGR